MTLAAPAALLTQPRPVLELSITDLPWAQFGPKVERAIAGVPFPMVWMPPPAGSYGSDAWRSTAPMSHPGPTGRGSPR
jgi:hypothetical protein